MPEIQRTAPISIRGQKGSQTEQGNPQPKSSTKGNPKHHRFNQNNIRINHTDKQEQPKQHHKKQRHNHAARKQDQAVREREPILERQKRRPTKTSGKDQSPGRKDIQTRDLKPSITNEQHT